MKLRILVLVITCLTATQLAFPNATINQDSPALSNLKNDVLALYDDFFSHDSKMLEESVNQQIADYLKQYELEQIDVLAEPLEQSEYYRNWYLQSLQRELDATTPSRYFKYDNFSSFQENHSRHLIDALREHTKPSLLAKQHTMEEMEALSSEVDRFLIEMEVLMRNHLANSGPLYIDETHIPDAVTEFADKLQHPSGESGQAAVALDKSLSIAYLVYLDHLICNLHSTQSESTRRDLLNIKVGPVYATMREEMSYDPMETGRKCIKDCLYFRDDYVTFPSLSYRLSVVFMQLAETPLGRIPAGCSSPGKPQSFDDDKFVLIDDFGFLSAGMACAKTE